MKSLITFLLFTIFINGYSQAVYKTPTGKKYHLASCRMVNNVSTELTIAEAHKLGLGPCGICHPPTSTISNFKTANKAKGQINGTVQCKGITKNGTRCKHRTSIANGYCFQHDPDKKQ